MPRLLFEPVFIGVLARLFRNRDNSFRESAIYRGRLEVYISPCRSAPRAANESTGVNHETQSSRRSCSLAARQRAGICTKQRRRQRHWPRRFLPDSTHFDDERKTRAEVQAELVAAYRDGSLPALNRTSYPNKGLIGQTQAARIALQEGTSGDVTRVANGQ